MRLGKLRHNLRLVLTVRNAPMSNYLTTLITRNLNDNKTGNFCVCWVYAVCDNCQFPVLSYEQHIWGEGRGEGVGDQQLVRCTGCYFVWPVLKQQQQQQRNTHTHTHKTTKHTTQWERTCGRRASMCVYGCEWACMYVSLCVCVCVCVCACVCACIF